MSGELRHVWIIKAEYTGQLVSYQLMEVSEKREIRRTAADYILTGSFLCTTATAQGNGSNFQLSTSPGTERVAANGISPWEKVGIRCGNKIP